MGESMLHKLGLGLICAHVLVLPLFFDVSALVVFAVPKALASYVLGLLTIGVISALVIRFGREALPTSPLHVPVACLLAVYAASTITALNPTVALIGAPDRALGLLTVLDGGLLYLAIVMVVRTRGEAIAVGACVFAPIPLVVSYEVIQWAGLDPLPWASGLVRTRPFATFGNAGVLALYLASLSVAAAVLAAYRAIGPSLRFTLAAIAGLALAGALLTATRAILVGYSLVAAMAAVLLLVRVASPRLRVGLMVGYAMSVLLVAGGVAVSPVGQRLEGIATSVQDLAVSGSSRDGSVSGRLALYEVAAQQVMLRPVLGVGPDNYTVAFPPLRPSNSIAALGAAAMETSPHSWIFHVATDAGIAGLAAYILTYATALVLAVRRGSPLALAAMGLVTALLGTGFFSVNDPGTDWLFWFGIGVVGSLTRLPNKSDSAATPARGGRRPPVLRTATATSALVLSFVLTLVPFGWLQGAEAAEMSRRARAVDRLPSAVSAARVAVARDPWRAEYWHGLGLSLARSGDHRGAIDAFGRAVALASYHTTYRTNLARAYVTPGLGSDRTLLREAIEHAEISVERDRNNSDAHFTLALALQAAGRPDDAVVASERAFALQPSAPDPFNYEIIGRAYLDIGRASEAERWLRLGLERGAGGLSVSLRLLLARSLATQQRVGEALAMLDSVLASEPNNAVAQRLRTELLSR